MALTLRPRRATASRGALLVVVAVGAPALLASRARADEPRPSAPSTDASASAATSSSVAAPSAIAPTAPAVPASASPSGSVTAAPTLPPPLPPPLTGPTGVAPSASVAPGAAPASSTDAAASSGAQVRGGATAGEDRAAAAAALASTESPRDRTNRRPHTIAELEAGIIALPNAPISPSQRGGATPIGSIGKGDATLMTGLHLLYRGAPEWAFGAGFLFGPSPTTDTQYGGLGNLPRTHSRNYLLVGGEGRYVPVATRKLEAWVGLHAGGVIVADRFTTETGDKVPTILGTREVTIRTEGFAFGVQVGGSWMFAERWVLGLSLRGDRWFLPNSPQCSPIGDCATIAGSVVAIETGVTIGYRIPL